MRPNYPWLTWAAALALTVQSGCTSKRAPEFSTGKQTNSLVAAAQEVIRAELKSNFGTPTSLVAWQVLPVDYGVFEGKTSKSGVSEVSVSLTGVTPTASSRRLAELRGSVVTNDVGNPIGTVAAYTPANGALRISSSDGTTIQPDQNLKVIGDGLQFGRDLYLRHCMHCHGVSGDGDGPTAKYFAVKPRDYRKGTFKFTSTIQGVRASRDDLKRIIKLGVAGTYMPSFMLLPDDEVASLVEYVRWLAMRGEVENSLYIEMSSDFGAETNREKSRADLKKEVEAFAASQFPMKTSEIGKDLAETWSAPEDETNVLMPKEPRGSADQDSIRRGRELFLNKDVGCFSCHGESARGNGVSTETFNKLPNSTELSKVPGLFDDWGNLVKPRDLTTGIYRGGRRPLDIYRRIRAGIKGTPMQGFSRLEEQQVWDLTNYVLSVPFKPNNEMKH